MNELINKINSYVNSQIPYIYNEGLTNLEALKELADKINEIIDAINLLPDFTSDLTAQFDDLKAYVENYIEQLNVAEDVSKVANIS